MIAVLRPIFNCGYSKLVMIIVTKWGMNFLHYAVLLRPVGLFKCTLNVLKLFLKNPCTCIQIVTRQHVMLQAILEVEVQFFKIFEHSLLFFMCCLCYFQWKIIAISSGIFLCCTILILSFLIQTFVMNWNNFNFFWSMFHCLRYVLNIQTSIWVLSSCANGDNFWCYN